jgi:[ribosomal protein S5]-alanine N-acetyltransferase
MKAPVLESDRLYYEPVSLRHLSQDYVDWLNDPEVYRYLESGGNYSLEMLQQFLQQFEDKPVLFWAIRLKSDNLHIGNIKIDPINPRHGLGEYGILMGRKSEWNKGYAKEASQTIISYCFNQVNLRKVTLGVVADNTSAVALYKKLGFEIEGVYRKHGVYGGKFCDVIRMALFNPAFSYND